MEEIKIFENPNFGSVRTVEINGEVWFVGKDVAEILGYSDPQKAVKMHVDDEDKLIRQIVVSGQNRNVTLINESGVYSLIFASKLPKAKEFKHWVTNEILPSIRKHGAYMTEQTIEQALTSPDFLIRLATELKTEQERRKALETAVEHMKPAAEYANKVLRTGGLLTATQIAKEYGMNVQPFNALLHSLGIQFKQNGQWLLYSQYHGCGYTRSETVLYTRSDGSQGSKIQTKWTEKGRAFIYMQLKKRMSIVPIAEREPITESKPEKTAKGKKWLESDIEYLRTAYPEGVPTEDIARHTGHTVCAVATKASKLGLRREV